MLNFIQAQSQPVILCIVSVITLAVAGGVLLLTRAISRRLPQLPFAAMVPVIVPISAILGLLLAFLAGRLWENFDKAVESVNREVGAINQIAAATRYLPASLRQQILTGVAVHVRHVENGEWQKMAADQSPILTSSAGLGMIREALVFSPQSEAERMAQQFILANLSEASLARTSRTRASQRVVAPIVWGTLLGLGFLTMCLVALLTGPYFILAAISTVFYALALSLTLTMLIAFDRPFSGGVEISTAAFQELSRHLENVGLKGGSAPRDLPGRGVRCGNDCGE